jgi:hypothetical protein
LRHVDARTCWIVFLMQQFPYRPSNPMLPKPSGDTILFSLVMVYWPSLSLHVRTKAV